MADPGFVSGFIGVGIQMTIGQILGHIRIALSCQKELANLKDLVMEIEPIVKDIQEDRLELNKNKISNSQSGNKSASAVNSWLKKLDMLLRQASAVAQHCTKPWYDVVSRYKASRTINSLISDIAHHLQLAPLVNLAQTAAQTPVLQVELGQIKESVQTMASSSASTSATTSQSLIASSGLFINEPLIVGQENALARLEKLVVDEAATSPFLRIGVIGKGGSGKTLLMKTLFNSKKVRDIFSDGLLLWLTVSQSPSIASLLNELSAQIAMQTNVDRGKNLNQEAVKIWLYERLQGKRFVLILDDVWEEGAKLLEELGLLRLTDCSMSTVIVSTRNRRVLLEIGVEEKYIITMEDLIADDSWRLFAYYAFPSTTRTHPNIQEGTAKIVCAKCGGLPLAIKAVGRAMAGVTSEYEWHLAARRLPGQDKEALHHCLRLSYDALGSSYEVNLQMCFLYLAAFLEDYIVQVDEAIPLWIGEGLLAKKQLQHPGGNDPFQMGRIYVNILADRCLIEPIGRDVDGRVLWFRIHDVLRDLAVQIAEQEENFYCGAGQGLTTLKENECSGATRILLNSNRLTSLPQSLSSPEICSLIVGNNNIRQVPKTLIGGMISLKVLDLSWTSLQSLPESVGSLKQLVFLSLAHVPLTRLPASLTNLVNLQILILSRSGITKLPSAFHKLRSLKYLDLNDCDDLQCLPCSISGLTSLEYLYMSNCRSLWRKHQGRHRWSKMQASIDDLGGLTELKSLYLENNGQTISEGTFGKLANMETLELTLTGMAGPPHDLNNMSKLKRLMLNCRLVVKMDFLPFQNLIHLRLWELHMLQELPPLHKLKSLRQLDIVRCCLELKRYPKEFSENGAFPALEILSLVELEVLEELPAVEESAMPFLKIFTMMKCPALKMMPMGYVNLKTLQKIRIYNCPMVLENLDEIRKANSSIEVVTTSMVDISEVYKSLQNFEDLQGSADSWVYDEFWCNELYLFLQSLWRRL